MNKSHRPMSDFVRILTLVALVVLGWLISKDLSEGNLPVAGGLIVVCVGTILGFNKQLKNECVRKAVEPQETERLAQGKAPQ